MPPECGESATRPRLRAALEDGPRDHAPAGLFRKAAEQRRERSAVDPESRQPQTGALTSQPRQRSIRGRRTRQSVMRAVPGFNVEVRRDGSTVVIAPIGEVDLA